MEQIKKLNLINNIFLSSKNINVSEGVARVSIENLEKPTIELLKLLNNDSIATEYFIEGIEIDDFSKLEEGKSIDVNLDISFLRTKEEYYFYATVDNFLENNRVVNHNKFFYINEIKASYKSIEKEKFHQYYSALIMLQKIINNLSVDILADTSTSDVTYIVFDKIKLSISSFYKYEDIKKIYDQEDFISIIAQLYDETVQEVDKRTNTLFLINALEGVFSNNKKIDISLIVTNIKNIYEDYQVHHRAYINSLEPEKVKSAYEENIQESLSKLNTLLSDVNNKMIFLPIAFIVSLGQLGPDSQVKNIVILIGMLIFCLLVYKFSITQQELLEGLKEDIEERELKFKDKTPKIFKEIESKIIRLNKLVLAVEKRFQWTIGLTWVVFGIVVVAVIYYYGLAHFGTFELFGDKNCSISSNFAHKFQ